MNKYIRYFIFFIGIFLLLISFIFFYGDYLVGYSIFSGEIGDYFGLIGFFIFFIGFFLIVISSSNLEGRVVDEINIVKTRRFEKAIRRHEQEVERAIKKLGTGLGHEHRLNNGELRGKYSMKTSAGGRIVYYRDDKGNYVLDDYTSDHKY